MAQGSFGKLEIFEDFLGPDNDLTWGTGTVQVGRLGFVSDNEGSFEWTVDEPGGILAITTDTGDNDNACLMAGTFAPADGGMVLEARFKLNDMTIGAIWVGFTETLSLATPVMPAEYATDTMTINGTGGMAGFNFDSDGTTDDFRAVVADAGALLGGITANGTRANATITNDRWYLARVEVDPNGMARCYLGDIDSGDELKVIDTSTVALGTSDKFYAALMVENRSGAAVLFEVDYFYASGFRDWSAS